MKSSSIIKDKTKVVSHKPQQINFNNAKVAEDFMATKNQNQFVLSEIVSQRIGVKQAEELKIEEQIKSETVERLKLVQEEAYKKAYDIGFQEGRKQAFDSESSVLKDKISFFQNVLNEIEAMKTNMLKENESHLIDLLFFITKKIIFTEPIEKKDIVIKILQEAIEDAQSNEKFTVRLSPNDFDFIENSKEQLTLEFEKFKKIKFERDPAITQGGCVIDTNYGFINSTIEERVIRLWTAIQENK